MSKHNLWQALLGNQIAFPYGAEKLFFGVSGKSVGEKDGQPSEAVPHDSERNTDYTMSLEQTTTEIINAVWKLVVRYGLFISGKSYM